MAWVTGWTRPVADPADENVVYTKENVFALDWSRPPGREASLAGLTLDRFKYPRDNRVSEGHGPSHRLINGVRRIGGKLFLYCGAQGTGSLEIYRFGEGCVAAPCGYVGGASIWRPEGGKRWPEDAESFIWTDDNGDGVPDPGEFASVKREPRWGSMHLDANAGIWQCSGETIWRLPCEGVDPRGNPIYRRASELAYRNPPQFANDRLRRLFYIPGDDVLITGGSPGTDENACNLLICFDRWSDPDRKAQALVDRSPSQRQDVYTRHGLRRRRSTGDLRLRRLPLRRLRIRLHPRPPAEGRRVRRHSPAGHQRLQGQWRLRRLGQRLERHPPRRRRVPPVPGKRRKEPRDDVPLDAARWKALIAYTVHLCAASGVDFSQAGKGGGNG